MDASRFRAVRCWPQAAARAWAFPSASASQPYVTFGGGRDGSLSLAGGAAFSIADENGKSVLDSTALCDAAFLFYSGPALTAEERYSVQSNVTATAQTGEADTQFGGNGGPGGSGGQRPDGMTPPDGAPSDGQMPQGQLPQSDAPPRRNCRLPAATEKNRAAIAICAPE